MHHIIGTGKFIEIQYNDQVYMYTDVHVMCPEISW